LIGTAERHSVSKTVRPGHYIRYGCFQ
jgi:hypothetical protein